MPSKKYNFENNLFIYVPLNAFTYADVYLRLVTAVHFAKYNVRHVSHRRIVCSDEYNSGNFHFSQIIYIAERGNTTRDVTQHPPVERGVPREEMYFATVVVSAARECRERRTNGDATY